MANAQLDAIRQALIANPILRPDATLEQMRAGMDAMGSMIPSLPGAQCTPVDAGGVPAVWVEIAGANRRRSRCICTAAVMSLARPPRTDRCWNALPAPPEAACLGWITAWRLSIPFRRR